VQRTVQQEQLQPSAYNNGSVQRLTFDRCSVHRTTGAAYCVPNAGVQVEVGVQMGERWGAYFRTVCRMPGYRWRSGFRWGNAGGAYFRTGRQKGRGTEEVG
jgi:hypothetical protein